MNRLAVLFGMTAVFCVAGVAPRALADPINDANFFDAVPHTLIAWEFDGEGVVNPVQSNITLPFDEYAALGLTIAPESPGVRLTNDTSPSFHILQAIGGSNPYGLNARSVDTASLNFSPPIHSFGFFFLDLSARFADFIARDVNDDIIEIVEFGGSFVDGTSGSIEYGFIGISSSTPIHRVETAAISGLIENLQFSTVPEPTTLSCLLLGAGVLATRRRRRRL